MADPLPRDVYRRDGILTLPGLFAPERLAAALAEVKGLLLRAMTRAQIPVEDPADEFGFHRAYVDLFQRAPDLFMAALQLAPCLPSFQGFCADPTLLAKLADLGITAPFCPTRPICYFLTDALPIPGDWHRAPPHQDWRYLQSSLDAVTVWIPLVDVDASVGTLEIIRATHHQGLLPTQASSHALRLRDDTYDAGAFEPVVLSRGDAAVFSGFLVHRSGLNRSGRVRWAVALRFGNLDERSFVERGMPNPWVWAPQLELQRPGWPGPGDLDGLFAPR